MPNTDELQKEMPVPRSFMFYYKEKWIYILFQYSANSFSEEKPCKKIA